MREIGEAGGDFVFEAVIDCAAVSDLLRRRQRPAVASYMPPIGWLA